jgi:hypothetical protein
MTTRELDQAKSEAFAERMIGILNDAALALMASIGHRTGLFDAMAGMPPPPPSRSPRQPTSTSVTCASGWAP